MTNSEIVQAVSRLRKSQFRSRGCVKSAGGAIYSVSDDDDDGDEPEPLRIANGEAASAIDVTMRYFEQSELATTEDVQHLSFIKRRVDYMHTATGSYGARHAG